MPLLLAPCLTTGLRLRRRWLCPLQDVLLEVLALDALEAGAGAAPRRLGRLGGRLSASLDDLLLALEEGLDLRLVLLALALWNSPMPGQ